MYGREGKRSQQHRALIMANKIIAKQKRDQTIKYQQKTLLNVNSEYQLLQKEAGGGRKEKSNEYVVWHDLDDRGGGK